MKKAFFFVALSLVLTWASGAPAHADIGYITIHNKAPYSVKVDVIFRVCSDDHPTIPPGGAWGTKIGLCHISSITATRPDGHQCGPGVRSLGSPVFYVVDKKYPSPHCEVHTSL